MEELNFTTKEIKVLNTVELDETQDAEIDKLFEVEVMDLEQIFGVSIDRETNNRISYN